MTIDINTPAGQTVFACRGDAKTLVVKAEHLPVV